MYISQNVAFCIVVLLGISVLTIGITLPEIHGHTIGTVPYNFGKGKCTVVPISVELTKIQYRPPQYGQIGGNWALAKAEFQDGSADAIGGWRGAGGNYAILEAPYRIYELEHNSMEHNGFRQGSFQADRWFAFSGGSNQDSFTIPHGDWSNKFGQIHWPGVELPKIEPDYKHYRCLEDTEPLVIYIEAWEVDGYMEPKNWLLHATDQYLPGMPKFGTFEEAIGTAGGYAEDIAGEYAGSLGGYVKDSLMDAAFGEKSGKSLTQSAKDVFKKKIDPRQWIPSWHTAFQSIITGIWNNSIDSENEFMGVDIVVIDISKQLKDKNEMDVTLTTVGTGSVKRFGETRLYNIGEMDFHFKISKGAVVDEWRAKQDDIRFHGFNWHELSTSEKFKKWFFEGHSSPNMLGYLATPFGISYKQNDMNPDPIQSIVYDSESDFSSSIQKIDFRKGWLGEFAERQKQLLVQQFEKFIPEESISTSQPIDKSPGSQSSPDARYIPNPIPSENIDNDLPSWVDEYYPYRKTMPFSLVSWYFSDPAHRDYFDTQLPEFTIFEIVGLSLDSNTGYPIDPETQFLVEPDTGWMINHQGEVVDVKYDLWYENQATRGVLPEIITGPQAIADLQERQNDFVFDPESNLLIDPKTGLLVDPGSLTYFVPDGEYNSMINFEEDWVFDRRSETMYKISTGEMMYGDGEFLLWGMFTNNCNYCELPKATDKELKVVKVAKKWLESGFVEGSYGAKTAVIEAHYNLVYEDETPASGIIVNYNVTENEFAVLADRGKQTTDENGHFWMNIGANELMIPALTDLEFLTKEGQILVFDEHYQDTAKAELCVAKASDPWVDKMRMGFDTKERWRVFWELTCENGDSIGSAMTVIEEVYYDKNGYSEKDLQYSSVSGDGTGRKGPYEMLHQFDGVWKYSVKDVYVETKGELERVEFAGGPTVVFVNRCVDVVENSEGELKCQKSIVTGPPTDEYNKVLPASEEDLQNEEQKQREGGGPIAYPGSYPVVPQLEKFQADGSKSIDTDEEGCCIEKWLWEIPSQQDIPIINADTSTPTISVPKVRRTFDTCDHYFPFDLQLTVTDDEGLTHSRAVKIEVQPDCDPVALLTVRGVTLDVFDHKTTTIKSGESITLDGSKSYDPDGGEIIYWQWHEKGSGDILQGGTSPTFVYQAPVLSEGNNMELRLGLMVMDKNGNWSFAGNQLDIKVQG